MNCPCCKQPLKKTKLPIVDLNNNRILLDGAYAHVKPQQAELLSVLVDRFPATVSYETLAERMWGVTGPDNVKNALKVIRCQLCRVLRNFGFDIKCSESRGYRLERVGT